ncbi:SDR family oxidoreductase [Vibrio cholerae]|uniref:SDR family oxidoreductase n=1 Tax=Vibrio cholerae TaxID=666 RepID=UPI0006158927|nr:SDR family oxidoreductase [Vibrio cholerae]MDF4532361.1 SDR family NAD(P)-dependent oxidoreductase [Vibrio parahaemolyticus]AKB02049.1 short chain dehydrogenase family protein [Vibrio cholerae]EGQ7644559.1 SDR family oxidoreductase [Vibrio cholerae]EGR2418609.1 SDR family oxidoreductase [Vibrio cholerae]EJL6273772.1 SDR family oxidoreductase [Vibrio cholerae]
MSKLYLVTGASSGIGLAICKNLLSSGHRVVGIARTEKAGIRELSDEYPKSFSFLSRDLSDDIDDLHRLPIQLAMQYGKFSGLVHAAGALFVLPNRFNTHEKMLATFNLNLFSGLALSRGLSDKKALCESGASIVFIASIAASVGATGTVNYGASKAALIGATKSLAKELSRQNIRVNTVSPGLIRTNLTQNHNDEPFFQRLEQVYPLGLGKPEYVADAVEFLLSNRSQWVTGTDLVVDGGITLGINE